MHPLRGGLRFAENISPSAPACRPETVRHPLPPEVDNAISKYESARGMAKTCVYNTVRGEEGGWRERRGGKVSGVFSLIFILLLLLPFFRLSFFRVLVVNSCGWDFCSFCFFFFPRWSLRKKGILGEISVLVSLLSLLIVCGCCIVWFKWRWLFLSFFFGGIFI